MDFKVKRFVLENGMEVVLVPRPHSYSIASVLSVRCGARHEDTSNYGIAHFLEHIISKETELWDNKRKLEEMVEMRGMYRNAFTSHVSTAYIFDGTPDDLDDILEYSRQIVFHPRFREDLVEEEKGIIAEELKMYLDSPSGYADYLVDEIKFAGDSLAVPLGGTVDSIQKITLEKIEEFYATHYQAGNMILGLAGKFEVGKVEKKIRQKFESYPIGQPLPYSNYQNDQKKTRWQVGQREAAQDILRFDFKGPGVSDPDRWVISILYGVLTSGGSSIFEQRLVRQLELVNDYDAYLSFYQDVSNLQLEFSAQSNNILAVVDEVSQILRRAKKGEFQDEVERAKQLFKTSFLSNLEDSASLVRYCVYNLQELGRIYSFDEIIDQINRISPQQVADAANKYFRTDNLSTVWVGNNPDPDEFESTVKRLQL